MSDLETPVLRRTVKLAADTGVHRFVDYDGSAPTVREDALGPIYVKGSNGDRVAATVFGFAPVVVSAAVAAGAPLEVLADGRVKTQAAGGVIVARAMEAATAANQVIEALILPNAKGN